MFDLDKWHEIFSSLRHNKLRAAMTAIGVFWGIFMLVFMLGCGNGLRDGVNRNIIGFASNSVYVWGARTGKPYEGHKPGRPVRFAMDDIQLIQKRVRGLDLLAPRIQLPPPREGNDVTRDARSGSFSVTGDYPELPAIQGVFVYEGRFIDAIDMEQHRKIAVLGEQARRELFDDDEDPIGRYIRIRGLYFQVVGVLNSSRSGDNGERENGTVYVPFSTFQSAFNGQNRVGWFALTAKPNVDAAVVEASVRRVLAERYGIAPDDAAAFGSFNAAEQFGHVNNLFDGVNGFIWFVGIATLLAGVLGVSNIMLISVKERTKEIGVRKALGATPFDIVSLVVQEAASLTGLAGYAGLVTGILALEVIERFGAKHSGPFGRPTVDVQTALVAMLVLLVAGVAAGIPPARHAATIHPVEALRAS